MNLAEQRVLAELYRPWKGTDSCGCPTQLHEWHDEGRWLLVLSHPAYLRHVQHRADTLGVSEVAGLVAALPLLRLGDDVPQDVRLHVAGPVMARIAHLLDNPGDNADLVRALEVLDRVLPPLRYGSRTADLRARARRQLGQDPPAGGWPAPTPRKWRPDRAERLERVERMLDANTFTSAYRELDQWQADTTNDQELAEIDELRAEAGRRAEQYRIKSRREQYVRVTVVVALTVGLMIWAVSAFWPW